MVALMRVMQMPRMLQRKWNGLAEVFVAMRGTGTFPAHELRIADDFHELLGLLENLMLAPLAEGFCHGFQNNISRAA